MTDDHWLVACVYAHRARDAVGVLARALPGDSSSVHGVDWERLLERVVEAEVAA